MPSSCGPEEREEGNPVTRALATLICLYWVFDIVLCTKVQKTFDLICRLVGLRSSVKAMPLVRIAHTMLQ